MGLSLKKHNERVKIQSWTELQSEVSSAMYQAPINQTVAYEMKCNFVVG